MTPPPDETPAAAHHQRLADRDWFIRTSDLISRGSVLLGAFGAALTSIMIVNLSGLNRADPVVVFVAVGFEFLAIAISGLFAAAIVRAMGVWAGSRGAVEIGVPVRSAEPVSFAAPMDHMDEVRRLIREGEWEAAEEAVRSLLAGRPDDPRGIAAAEELERAKAAALEHWEARLHAARDVNDPDQVLEAHERIGPLTDLEKRKALDGELGRWFLVVVHRRLRTGRIQPDVVALADRIAERFGHTTEGASLRAALPTLRRSAGLCPKCAKPYTGLAAACPECLVTTTSATAPEFEPDELDEPLVEAEDREPDWFVDRSEDPV